jgi:hypothetical protein
VCRHCLIRDYSRLRIAAWWLRLSRVTGALGSGQLNHNTFRCCPFDQGRHSSANLLGSLLDRPLPLRLLHRSHSPVALCDSFGREFQLPPMRCFHRCGRRRVLDCYPSVHRELARVFREFLCQFVRPRQWEVPETVFVASPPICSELLAIWPKGQMIR